MKLKIFTLGLLAALTMTSMNSDAMQRQQARAAQQNPVVQAEKAQAHAAHGGIMAALGAIPGPDAATKIANLEAEIEPGAGNLTTAIANVNAIIHAAGPADAHAKMTLVNGLIHAGGPADGHAKMTLVNGLIHAGGPADAHAKMALVNALIHAGGPADAHAKMTLVNGLLGVAGTVDAHGKIAVINGKLGPAGAVQGAATNAGGGAAVADEIEAKLDAILARLKAGLAHNIAQGVAIECAVTTKTNHTAAGAITHGAGGRDAERAAAAMNIENFLAEIGW